MSPKTTAVTPALADYIASVGYREPEILARLRAETERVIGRMAVMQIAADQGQAMAMLVRLMGVRRMVEVGTFTGYSSLACALALPPDGHIDCCDVSEEYTAIARRYWAEAEVAERIALHVSPGVETLDRLISEGKSGSYDLAFIDADKPNYPHYYERCLTLLRPGGAVLVDNVLWGGAVADPGNQEDGTVAIRAFNAALHGDDRVDLALIPIGDGLTVARKR